MSAVAISELPLLQQEEEYHKITDMYDILEQIIETVQEAPAQSLESLIALMEPLLSEVGESVDVLSEEFLHILTHEYIRRTRRKRIHATLRRIYTAIEQYKQRAAEETRSITRSILSSINTLVQRLKRQTEVVVALFMHCLDLSLSAIMTPVQITEFTQHHNVQMQHGT